MSVLNGNQKYPWDEWSDGEFRRVRSSSFGVSAEVLRQQICRAAKRMGSKVQTSVHGKYVSFQFNPPALKGN